MSVAALLDHPWPIEDAFNYASGAFRVLERFETLIRTYNLGIVPFFSEAEVDGLWGRLAPATKRHSGYAAVIRLVFQCVRRNENLCRAIPNPEPADLGDEWKRALRDGIVAAASWREPQIIVPASRMDQWNEPVVQVTVEPCGEEPERSSDYVAVSLDTAAYAQHPFAQSDFDPWDLQRTSPPAAQGEHARHPCQLPRPDSVPTRDTPSLNEAIRQARSAGWNRGGQYCFIPPDAWRVEAISKGNWRAGRIFARGQIQRHAGYVDCEGRIWEWDSAERHWDVQFPGGGYARISHTGENLG